MNKIQIFVLIVFIFALHIVGFSLAAKAKQQQTITDQIEVDNLQSLVDTCTYGTRGQINMSVSVNSNTGRTITWTFEDIDPNLITIVK